MRDTLRIRPEAHNVPRVVYSFGKALIAAPTPAGRRSWSLDKKSKRGIETPKEDMDIIRTRLKVAQALAKEL